MFTVGRWRQKGGQNRVREKAPFPVPSFPTESMHAGRSDVSSSTPSPNMPISIGFIFVDDLGLRVFVGP